MELDRIKLEFNTFIENYDWEGIDQIWQNQKSKFRDFWGNRLKINKDLSESEIDEIVRILDKNAKGNKKENQAVAKAMIPQGVWRRMFSEIKNSKELYDALNEIFNSKESEIIKKVDELYKINETGKNGLTGKSSNAINAFLFANSPDKFISIISLKERERILNFLGFKNSINFEEDSQGEKIYFSNKVIIEGFKDIGITASPRTITAFIYSDQIKPLWREYSGAWGGRSENLEEESPQIVEESSKDVGDSNEFEIEKELENFMVRNWENIDLGKDYELILDEEGLPSQQYNIGKWFIDILARKKGSKDDYLVIELKKGKAADRVVGQVCRYMTWIKKHKLNGKGSVKGLIISASVNDELRYAVEGALDVELKTYKINFKLENVEGLFKDAN